MIYALQSQPAIQDVLDKLQTLQLDAVIDRIALHSVAAVVTAGCTVLLARTAAGTLHSRFLRHLAMSVGLNILFRLGNIVYLLSNAALAFLAAGHTEDQHSQTIAKVVLTLDSAWHGIDITISLLASWFLLATWYLLRRYPNEAVDRTVFTSLTLAFWVGVLGVLADLLNLADKTQARLWQILTIFDVTAATTGLLLVGWQLQKTLGPKIKSKNPVVRSTVPWTTTFLFLLWGGVQPFYPWFKDSSWYSVALLMTGVSAIIMTIILCSQTLDEKPEYLSSARRAGRGPGG